MSLKAVKLLKRLATDPIKARYLSAQMLHAQRSGKNPVIISDGMRIELKRVTQKKLDL